MKAPVMISPFDDLQTSLKQFQRAVRVLVMRQVGSIEIVVGHWPPLPVLAGFMVRSRTSELV